MISEEERQEIINAAVEKAILLLPEVVGNLITNQVNLLKLNRTFYEKFPEFSTSKDLVAQVVEKVEGDNPGLDYAKILEQAVPIIKEQMKTIKSLNVTTVSKPNRKLDQLTLGSADHGEL